MSGDVSAVSDKSQKSGIISPHSPHASAASPVDIYLDTSTPVTTLKINDQTYTWESGRELAEGLLKFLSDSLAKNNKTLNDITKITFFSGPGSFTGLRIGAAVVNTLASELGIPLYDHTGHQHPIILPDYSTNR